MAELPRYKIHTTFPGAYVERIGILETGQIYELPEDIVPRNSWEPVNAAAHEAFRKRNDKHLSESKAGLDEIQQTIDDAKADGAKDAELAGLYDELAKKRVDHAALPRALKAVPSFGAARPKYSLAPYVPQPPAVEVPAAPIEPTVIKAIEAPKASPVAAPVATLIDPSKIEPAKKQKRASDAE